MAKELLTDQFIRSTKSTVKNIRLSDGNNLYLLIKPNNSRLWRIDYSINSKRKTLSLGGYPLTSLSNARKGALELKKLVASGVDPSTVRKNTKEREIKQKINQDRAKGGLNPLGSFKHVADEWYEKKMQLMADSYKGRVYSRLERDIFPFIGKKPIIDVSAQELLQVIQKIEDRGAVESAHRTLRTCGQIFRYGIVTGRVENDITIALKGALSAVKGGHFSAITDESQLKGLLKSIESFSGSKVVHSALRLAPHVFVRPIELRTAKWKDINFETKEWRYLVSKTKTEHIVPLSSQVVLILKEIEPYTGSGEHVFPSARTPNGSRPLSDVALLAALRRLGYEKDVVTVHGFRATARTLLDEVLKYRPDYIEHQLAHRVKDPLGRAYNRTTHLEERRGMMQGWSDYLMKLRES